MHAKKLEIIKIINKHDLDLKTNLKESSSKQMKFKIFLVGTIFGLTNLATQATGKVLEPVDALEKQLLITKTIATQCFKRCALNLEQTCEDECLDFFLNNLRAIEYENTDLLKSVCRSYLNRLERQSWQKALAIKRNGKSFNDFSKAMVREIKARQELIKK